MPKNEPILLNERLTSTRHVLRHVQRALDFIEDNLIEPLSIESIAAAAALSPYHLHRLFSGLTGIPLIQYVRERRLSVSAEVLHASNRPILEIATHFGYEHEQSYIRAFRRRYGVSPARCRRDRIELDLFERFGPDDIVHVEGGLLVRPKFVMRPAFVLLGTQTTICRSTEPTTSSANLHARAFMMQDAPRISDPVSRGVYFGLVEDLRENPGHARYISALEVRSGTTAIQGMSIRAFPPGRYGVVRYVGMHAPEDLNYQKLLGLKDLIRNSGLAKYPSDHPPYWHIERIDTARCTKAYCEASLLFPA